jgi:hypothetical protein
MGQGWPQFSCHWSRRLWETFLIKQIVNYLHSKGKTVTIACSTGIASTHYGKLGGTTLHKWAGIGDDRYLNEEIVHLIKTDERFNDVKDNVQSTNTLNLVHNN